MRDKRSKLLRLEGPTRHHLEDVNAIVAESGCSAIVCLPLVVPEAGSSSCSAAAAAAGSACLGALIVGFRSATDITSPALKGALLLAHALAVEHHGPLQELAALVASMLLPPPPFPPLLDDDVPNGGAEWDSSDEEEWRTGDLDYGPSGSSDDGSGSSGSGGGVGGARRAATWQPPPAQAGGWLSLLAFGSCGLERQFSAYHAAHMLRVDAWAYLICFCFYCLEVFLPGTPFRLRERMGLRCLMGCVSLLPGAMLLSKRTRAWYGRNRDLVLLFTWCLVTAWQTAISNYLHLLGRASFRHPLYLQSFGWLTVMGLAFQMRFRFQVLACPLAFAVNITLLPAICSKFYEEQGGRCVAAGGLRVFLHGVVLPLACCYVFESHARRLFLRADNRGWCA